MMRRRLCILLALAFFAAPFRTLHAQTGLPQPVFLWPNGAPGALGDTEADKPRMYAFLPRQRSTSAAILVIPGGSYRHVAMGHEGFQIAQWLNEQGMPAFVLDYRVSPYRYPVEIDDGRRAMRLIRAHAAEYGIDPNRIGVWGSSAGGHLASTLGTHCESAATMAVSATGDARAGSAENHDAVDKVSCKPDFMVLAYPVITMEKPVTDSDSQEDLFGLDPNPALLHDYSNQFAVTKDTPPTFIFATSFDPGVSVENSLDFYRALERTHVPVEMHLFDYSDHGCGLCGSIIPLRVWPGFLRTWLIDKSFLPPNAPPLPAPMPNWPVWPKGLTGPGKF